MEDGRPRPSASFESVFLFQFLQGRTRIGLEFSGLIQQIWRCAGKPSFQPDDSLSPQTASNLHDVIG